MTTLNIIIKHYEQQEELGSAIFTNSVSKYLKKFVADELSELCKMYEKGYEAGKNGEEPLIQNTINLHFEGINYETNRIHHCGNTLTEKEVEFDHCLKCSEYLTAND